MSNRLAAALLCLGTAAALSNGVAKAADGAIEPWTKLGGIPGGNIGRIAFDPRNPATMFVGADGGGTIFRSTDGGASFTAIAVGGVSEGFRAIAVDPVDSNIVFAFSADQNNFGAAGGVYESRSGGVAWARIANQPVAMDHGVVGQGRALVMNRSGKALVIADRDEGIFRSTDQGAHWKNVLPRPQSRAYTLVADPDHPDTLWAGGYEPDLGFPAVLWRSTDFGKTWITALIAPLDQTLSPLPYAIAVLPGSGKIVVGWNGSDPYTNAPLGGVVTKAAHGPWVNSSAGLPQDAAAGNAIIVDPQIPTTLFLTTSGGAFPNGLFRSEDSGTTWQPIGAAVGGADGIFTAAARPATKTMPAAIFVGGSDLFGSTDHGQSWTRQDSGLAIGAINAIADDLLSAHGLYAATADGLFHSPDAGRSWVRISNWIGATVPRGIAIDPVTPAHAIYAATATGFWRSADAGRTWVSSILPGNPTDIAHLAADPVQGGRVYAADSTNGFYHSDDGGATWTRAVVGISSDVFMGNPSPIVVEPGKSGIVYAGMTSGLWRSDDAGSHWRQTALPAGPGSIGALAILPGLPNAIYIQADTGELNAIGANISTLQCSVDSGQNWQVVTYPFGGETLSFYSVSAAPEGTTLYAYSAVRFNSSAYGNVLESRDGGLHWDSIDQPLQPFLNNLPVVIATAHDLYIGDRAPLSSGNNFVLPLQTTPVVQPIKPACAKIRSLER